MSNTGTLYLVSTPIGNLKDISQRALETLENTDLILAEDTRTSSLIFSQLPLKCKKRFLSYHKFNEQNRLSEIAELLTSGKNIALVSDAGMPCISDPGYLLVDYLRRKYPDIDIIPLPGANAALTALIGSGLPTDRFYFAGFIPKKVNDIHRELASWKTLLEQRCTVITYEAPHRLLKTLEILSTDNYFSAVTLVTARELTKAHEEFIQGNAKELIEHFTKHNPRGEFVLLLADTSTSNKIQVSPAESPQINCETLIDELINYPLTDKDIYQLCQKLIPASDLPRKNQVMSMIRYKRNN